MTREEHTDVVEIDAIANEEWERDQHTPQAIESNLAALVKQSASTSSGPVRQLDEGWEEADPAKPRTTTNTLRRADDGKKNRTMALPTTVKPPSTKSTSQGLTPVAARTTPPKATPVAKPPPAPEPKLARSSSPALTPVEKPADKKTSSPALTPVATKPVEKKTSSPALTPVAAKPSEKPAPTKTSSPTLTPVAAKPPETKPTPAKTSSPALTPVAAKPVEVKSAPAPLAAKPVEAKSTPAPLAAKEPLVARAPTPPPMDLPVWPPKSEAKADFEDWENPNAATSIGNRVPPTKPRAVSEDAISSFLKEDSIIIDLNAVAHERTTPRRPQTYPVIQTSEINTTTSGVFDMPSPSATTVVLPLPAPAPEVATVAQRPSFTWNTPLPQPMPGEPNAAPPVPSWPSAAGLDHAIPEQVKHEPTAAARRPRLATVFATLQRRRNVVLIATAVSVLVLVVEFALPNPAAKTTAVEPTVTTHVAARAETPAPKPAQPQTSETPAKRPVVAAADPVVQDHAKPATPAKQPVKRRISRKRPVVVDYDKKPDPALSQDEALANARTAYATGNQHLFAGETDAAIISYKKALADYPGYAAGYRGLGLAYTQQSDRAAALTAFKTYVKLAPTAKDVTLIEKRIRGLSAAVAIHH
jgi:hypothetical protein